MNRVFLDVVQTLRWADVVSKSSNWGSVSSHVVVLPLSKQTDDEVASEFSSQDLSEEVDVGHKGALQDDRNVRRVEKLDWERLSVASHLSAAQAKFNSETLNKNKVKVFKQLT